MTPSLGDVVFVCEVVAAVVLLAMWGRRARRPETSPDRSGDLRRQGPKPRSGKEAPYGG
ncbi:hypothetical protein [Thermomonospora cellulosilytica]|uniref:Uncharacterized protein n=1 Tax=Thermomonospora cellulosilytica TaxID=1411118 RepID=A0A7W3RAK9_9ACTN|nr:hypothetical protein [Thermomonospora cellulosilytica]MBA9005987.1 hypothetical protein [Thermomonospora cellulosilytica]